jgi:crossover junction endodeoxyribonuclease RuvC
MLMRVLGVDPGTRHLGWGVLEQTGTRVEHVAHGVIDADERKTLAERLVIIDDAFSIVVETHRPDVAAVESLFFAKDAQSAAKLGHARGVILLRLAKASLPIFEIAPARVKRAVAGGGMASKEQVARMMTAILRLAVQPRPDAADALANAFAHLTIAKFDEAVTASKRARLR